MDFDKFRQVLGILAEKPDAADSILEAEGAGYDGQDGDQGGDGGGDGGDDPSDDPTLVEAMDVDLEAEATATFSRESDDVDLDDDVQAGVDDPEKLTGIIWGAGKHNLGLNGQATGVFVPDGETAVQVEGEDVVFSDTIEPTFRQLKADIQSDDRKNPTLGFDHPDGDSVAAESGIVDLGPMKDVALSADQRNIVLTDSELTSESAIEANERGDLEKYDFSIVAKVAKQRDDDGDVVTTDDGRIVLAATRIERADIVRDGAVDAASIGDVPELAASFSDPADVDAGELATAFRAEAKNHTETDMDGLNPDDFDTVGAALEAAADQVEEKESRIDDLEAQVETYEPKADAFEDVAEAEDVDVDEYDDAAEAAQAVVDARTEPLRKEIAATESELPGYDTGTDDGPSTEDRVDDLAGSSVSELKAQRGDLAVEVLRAGKKKEQFGSAIAAGEGAGEVSDLESGGAGGSDEDADELAASVLSPIEQRDAEKNGQSPAEYVQAEKDVDPAEFDSEASLSAAIRGSN